MLFHLAMCKRYLCLRHQFCDLICHLHNGIDPVINVVNLPAPRQLPADRFAHHLFIIFHHVCLDRHTLLRRFFQHAHVTDSDEAHAQRPRNRRRGQCQDIHISR